MKNREIQERRTIMTLDVAILLVGPLLRREPAYREEVIRRLSTLLEASKTAGECTNFEVLDWALATVREEVARTE